LFQAAEATGVVVRQQTFDDLSAPLFDVPFCVLDLETTGATPRDCEITEIGAVKYRNGELAGTFHTLVNPGVPIPPTIVVLTGITQFMVVEAPLIGEALPAFLEFLSDTVIVGHNVRFDMSFLNAAAERLGYARLANTTIDTAALSRRLLRNEVRDNRLGTLAAHFRSPVEPNHRALEDAKATAHVFFELLARAGGIGVTHLDDLVKLPTARGNPQYGKLGLTDALPRRPGVYRFIDRDGVTIYVGKAKNLRTRVRSYFYGDTRRTVHQMLRDLDRIEHTVCATELEAEITELRMIHAHRPRYNRRSRPPKSTHWVKLTSERFPRLSIVRTLQDDGCLHLGPFRSKRTAELVMHGIWDAVPIRRCLTKRGSRSAACHFAQLGVAVCPCDGSVEERAYGRIVDDLRDALDMRPHDLLQPLAARMLRHAREERFEDAAIIRDRYRAVATALERKRAWRALEDAGRIWAENADGEAVVCDHGRLGAAWGRRDPIPLLPVAAGAPTRLGVPPSVALAEEAHLIWRWFTQEGVRIVESDRPVVFPASPVPRLERWAS
jgi:DNA polymerase-3 subunit epsilon